MTNKVSNIAKERKKYSPQFKEQAVLRAKKNGMKKTANDLNIAEAMLYSWRKKSESTGIPFEDQKIQVAETARLKRENTRLAEENAFLKKAAAYFSKEPK